MLLTTMFSFGYQTYRPAQLLKWVFENNAIVIDIRYSPRSSRKEWDGEALKRALEPLPGAYRHMGSLGNRNYRGGDIQVVDITGGCQIVRDEMLPLGRPLVLMCVCRNYDTCHRKNVARYLEASIPGVECEELILPAEEKEEDKQLRLF